MSKGNKCSNIKRCAENMGSCFSHLFIFILIGGGGVVGWCDGPG